MEQRPAPSIRSDPLAAYVTTGATHSAGQTVVRIGVASTLAVRAADSTPLARLPCNANAATDNRSIVAAKSARGKPPLTRRIICLNHGTRWSAAGLPEVKTHHPTQLLWSGAAHHTDTIGAPGSGTAHSPADPAILVVGVEVHFTTVTVVVVAVCEVCIASESAASAHRTDTSRICSVSTSWTALPATTVRPAHTSRAAGHTRFIHVRIGHIAIWDIDTGNVIAGNVVVRDVGARNICRITAIYHIECILSIRRSTRVYRH